MASPDARLIADGLQALAHAIRRSTARYLAVYESNDQTPPAEIDRRSDLHAQWILGKAGAARQEPTSTDEDDTPKPWENEERPWQA